VLGGPQSGGDFLRRLELAYMALAVVEGQRWHSYPSARAMARVVAESSPPERRTTALVAIRRLLGAPEKHVQPRGEAETVALARFDHPRGALEEVLAAHGLGWSSMRARGRAKRSASFRTSATSASSVTTNFHQASCARRPRIGLGLDAPGFDDAGAGELDRDIPLDGAADASGGGRMPEVSTSMAKLRSPRLRAAARRVVIPAARLGDHGTPAREGRGLVHERVQIDGASGLGPRVLGVAPGASD